MSADWSVAPNTPGLKLKWADGWIDDFLEEEFAEECENRPSGVYMYHRKQPRCFSEYTLTVAGHEAVLDYGGQFEAVNLQPERDIDTGEVKIVFTDESRSSVSDVLFRRKGTTRFTSYDVDASWSDDADQEIGRPFRPDRRDRRPRGVLEGVLRPGQLRFRRRLLRVYNSRCCMTGCTLEDTLEAAHIMPYRGPQYDHVQNGLLLRADLHRLYDRLFLSIDPRSLLIRMRSRLKRHTEYAALEGSKVTVPIRRSNQPAAVALEDHWRRFAKTK